MNTKDKLIEKQREYIAWLKESCYGEGSTNLEYQISALESELKESQKDEPVVFEYKGYMSDDATTFFKGNIIEEQRDGCAVVGSFLKLSDGSVCLPSKGDRFKREKDGSISKILTTKDEPDIDIVEMSYSEHFEKEQILKDLANKISTKSLYDDPELANASNRAVNELIKEMKPKDEPKMSAEEWFDNHFDCYTDEAIKQKLVPAITKKTFLEYANQFKVK